MEPSSFANRVVISHSECLWLLGILGHKATQDQSCKSLGEFIGYMTIGMAMMHDLTCRYDISEKRLIQKQEHFDPDEMALALRRAVQYDENKHILEETVDLYVRHMDLDHPDDARQTLLDTFHDIDRHNVVLEPFVRNRETLYRKVGDLDCDILIRAGRDYLEQMENFVLRPAA
jgi:hypothetical protein